MKHIKTQEQLNEDKKLNLSDVSCRISYNQSEEMIQITNKDGEVVFGGNYWDFDESPEGLKKLFEALGLQVSIDDELPSIG